MSQHISRASQLNKLKHEDPELWHLRRVFGRIDDDASGEIDRDELYQALVDLGFDTSREKVNIMFNAADADNNNTVDFDEFVQLVESMKSESGDNTKRLWMEAMASVDDEKFHKIANAAAVEPLRRSKEDIIFLTDHVYRSLSDLGIPCFTKAAAKILAQVLQRQVQGYEHLIGAHGAVIEGCVLLLRGAISATEHIHIDEQKTPTAMDTEDVMDDVLVEKTKEEVCTLMFQITSCCMAFGIASFKIRNSCVRRAILLECRSALDRYVLSVTMNALRCGTSMLK